MRRSGAGLLEEETEAGRSRLQVGAGGQSRRSSPSDPTAIFFLYSPVLRLWPLSSWNLKFCNSQAKYCRAAGTPSRKTVTLTSSLCASQALFQALSVD